MENVIAHSAYHPALWGMALTGLLILVQLIIADISALRIKHTPGAPIDADHKDFVFRAARSHANTNESVACFILFSMGGILANADSLWLNTFVWLYVFCRIGHMLSYYANQSTLRSLSFGISLAALLGLFGITAVALS